MAATFSFSTTTILSGHAMRIYSTSLNWSEYIPGDSSSAVLTISTLDSGNTLIGPSNTFTKALMPVDLVGDFYADITSLELYGVDQIIPDNILNVKIDIVGASEYTYNTDEVFYYNAWKHKSTICLDAVDFICDMNSTEIKYACMVNVLYQGLIADIVAANTSGIYEKIDLFKRLSL